MRNSVESDYKWRLELLAQGGDDVFVYVNIENREVNLEDEGFYRTTMNRNNESMSNRDINIILFEWLAMLAKYLINFFLKDSSSNKRGW